MRAFFNTSLFTILLSTGCIMGTVETKLQEPIIIPPEGSDLAHDFQGKTRISIDTIGAYINCKKNGENIGDLRYYRPGDEEEYFAGCYSGSTSPDIDNYYIHMGSFYFVGNNSPYYHKPHCVMGYNTSGKRLFEPQCSLMVYVWDSSDDLRQYVMSVIFTQGQEMLFYDYVGDNIETAKEYFFLPPFHVGIKP